MVKQEQQKDPIKAGRTF